MKSRVCVWSLNDKQAEVTCVCLFTYWQAGLNRRTCSLTDRQDWTGVPVLLLTGTAEVMCVCTSVNLLTGTNKVKFVCAVTDRHKCTQGCAYLLTGTNTVKWICSLTDRHDYRQICAYLVTGTTEVRPVCLFGTIEGRWIPLVIVKHDLNQVYRFTYSRMMSAASVRWQSLFITTSLHLPTCFK